MVNRYALKQLLEKRHTSFKPDTYLWIDQSYITHERLLETLYDHGNVILGKQYVHDHK